MGLTTVYATFVAQATVGSATPFFNNSNAYLGVGDSNTAFAIAQTDLQAASNKLRKKMDGGYPTQSGGALVFQATFSTAEANWYWREWAVFNGSAGIMMNRCATDIGSKTNAETWALTVTITNSVS